MVYDTAQLLKIFSNEIDDILKGRFSSILSLHKSWILYLRSWLVTEKCILNSLNIDYDERNAIMYELQQSVVELQQIIELFKSQILDEKITCMVALFSICFGLSFVYLLQVQGYFELLVHTNIDRGSNGFKLLIHSIKDHQIVNLPGLQNDDVFKSYIEQISDQEIQLNIKLPRKNKFDLGFVNLLEEVSKAFTQLNGQIITNHILDNQKEKLQQQIQDQEKLINSELEERFYYVVVGFYHDLLNDYLHLEQSQSQISYQDNKPHFYEIKNLDDLNNRDSFSIDEFIDVKEGQHVEYKYFHHEIDTKREFIIKKVISSFLNSNGGTLYIGITDQKNVKGYNMGDFTLSEQLNDLQNIVNHIHPCPKYGSQYSINLLPIYNYQGIILDNKIIIKIQVYDFEIKPNVYSFQLFLQDYGCETICTFYRTQDSSRFLNQRNFKEKILQQSQRQPNRQVEEQKTQRPKRQVMVTNNYQASSNKKNRVKSNYKRNGSHQQEKAWTRSSSINRFQNGVTRNFSPIPKRVNSQPKSQIYENLQQIQSQQTRKTRNHIKHDLPQLVECQITQFQQLSPILKKKINFLQTLITNDNNEPVDNIERSLIATNDEEEDKQRDEGIRNFTDLKHIFGVKKSNEEEAKQRDEEIKNFNDQKHIFRVEKQNNYKQQQPINDRKKCLIIRKIKPECLILVTETLQFLIKGTSGRISKLESTMMIGFDSEAELLTLKTDMLSVMQIQAIGKNTQVQFTFGEPTNQLDLERQSDQLNDQELKKLIIEQTNLRNFNIKQYPLKCLITVETLEDQILIYRKLKQMKKRAYWRLVDKKEIKINFS